MGEKKHKNFLCGGIILFVQQKNVSEMNLTISYSFWGKLLKLKKGISEWIHD